MVTRSPERTHSPSFLGPCHSPLAEMAPVKSRSNYECEVACARRCVEHSGIPATDWICVNDTGIVKVHSFDIASGAVESVTEKTLQLLVGARQLKAEYANDHD
jgi:hypothetical protein